MPHHHATRLLVPFSAALLLCACPGRDGSGGGAPTFSKSYGADALDLATDVAPTPDGGYVLVGSFNGRQLGGEVVDEDLWVTRLDAYGDLVWSRVYSENQTSVGAADEAYLYHIALPRTGGGFFLVGQLDELVALDALAISPEELAVARLDDDGNTLWTQSYGFQAVPQFALLDPDQPPSAAAYSAVPTRDGGLLVAGFAGATVSVGKAAASVIAPWVMKLDANGNRLWSDFVDDELYGVAAYYNAGIHVRETGDGGAVVAVPMAVKVDNPSLYPLEDSTQVKRFDALGGTVWTRRHDGFVAEDLVVFQRSGAGEGYLIVAEDLDRISSAEQVLSVLDEAGNELRHRDNVDAFDWIYSGAELTGPAGENLFGVVGPSDEAGDPDSLRLEVFDDDLMPLAQVDLQGTRSLFALRSFDEGLFTGFELLASDLQDPESGTGDLLNIRITPQGSIIRYTRYPRDVPAFVNWSDQRGRRTGGWIEGTTDYWLWTPVDRRDLSRGMILSRYALTAGLQWSKTFGPELDRRVERALQVEVIPDPTDPQDPNAFEIAVLGEVAWSLLENPPPPGEPLSAWILRLDADGEPRSQRVLEPLTLTHDDELFPLNLFWLGTPELRRSAPCLQAAADGGLFVGGRVQGYDRITRLDADSSVVWCTRPLVEAERSPLQAIEATADGGVVAVGADWLAKVDQDGALVWRRVLSSGSASGVCELASGELLAGAIFSGQPGLLALDGDGEPLWQRLIDRGGAALHDGIVGLVATPDGGAVLAFGELNPLTGPSAGVIGDDTWDLRLVKVDASGSFLWSQTYGGLVEEALGGIAVAPDGGLLIAGRSDSLGVGSEAWLLRTDSCGEITQSCRAALRRTEPLSSGPTALFAAVPYQPSIAPADDVPGTPQPFPTAARQSFVTDRVVVARQCSGSSKDRLPVEEVLLTVTVAEGSGVLREDVGPGESPLVACITSCQVAVPEGTRVRLRATPDAGYLPALWSGGDCGPGPAATCSVLMDADRTVSVAFPVDEGGYMGELYALTVDFLGSGAGSVAIQPLNATCTQDCSFADLAVPGDTFFLTATPAPGASFGGWVGADDADANVARVTFGAADRTVGVRFDP